MCQVIPWDSIAEMLAENAAKNVAVRINNATIFGICVLRFCIVIIKFSDNVFVCCENHKRSAMFVKIANFM